MNFFRRTPGPSPDVEKALDRLTRLSRNHPDLASASGLLREVLLASFPAASQPVPTSTPVLDPMAFRAMATALDSGRLDARGRAILKVLAPHAEPARVCLELVRSGRLSIPRLARSRFAPEEFDLGGVPDAFVAAFLRPLWLPDLGTIPRDERDDEWFCAWCGDAPLLAESRGIEQRRVLRCGTCGGSARAPRLGCPCCREADPARTRIVTVGDDADPRSLLACLTCGTRLKILRVLVPLTPPELLAAELELAHLELIEVNGEG